jgi:eukaryotic-like serine/threonine-protein kinase
MGERLFGHRVREVFDATAALDPAEAARRLDVECAGDPVLREVVELLLTPVSVRPQALAVREAARLAAMEAPTPVIASDVWTTQKNLPSDPAGYPALNLSSRYEDAGHIGRGGMGEVRAIRDAALGREVAAKMLERSLAANPAFVRGFVEEAQITAQLDHPNIVPVHDLGTDLSGTVYFTMKRVRGQTLEAILADPALALGTSARLATALDVFLKTCDAVAFAHSRGVLHRDIKPANIMVGAFGEVYLMDWGVAKVKATSGRPGGGQEEGRVGTPGFMPPEVVNLQYARVDERADIFGLGAVLYEIVTGRPPFRGSTVEEIFEKTVAYELVPPDECGDVLVSKKLARVILRAMAREPEDRYATAGELAGQVREFLHRGLHLPQATFEAGQTIVCEGEIGKQAYIITRGRCEVYKTVGGERRALRAMGPGALFGEAAILDAAPRTATVEAATGVTVLVLTRDVLEDSFSRDTWEGLLAKTLVERFRELDERLVLIAAGAGG